jgi:hypothetical protein
VEEVGPATSVSHGRAGRPGRVGDEAPVTAADGRVAGGRSQVGGQRSCASTGWWLPAKEVREASSGALAG